jgi:Domain of unknown function (DUF1413)
MRTIKTQVDDATYATLVTKRKAAGLPSVSALFLRECGVLTDHVEASAIARRALTRAKKKPGGIEYRLGDLFPPQEWQKFSKGARLRAGKMFHAEVGAAVHGIRATRKSSSNHQYYMTA